MTRDQDLKRLGEYVNGKDQLFRSIKRDEQHSDAVARWPVLSEADSRLAALVLAARSPVASEDEQ